MSIKVNQPSINPTRKLTAAVIATAVMEIARVLSQQLFPGVFDLAFWSAMAPIVVFAVGYFVRDDANVVFEFEGENGQNKPDVGT